MIGKLFDTALGQVVVLCQNDEEGDPEIRYFFKPDRGGTCSIAMSYHSEEMRDSLFQTLELPEVEGIAYEIQSYF